MARNVFGIDSNKDFEYNRLHGVDGIITEQNPWKVVDGQTAAPESSNVYGAPGVIWVDETNNLAYISIADDGEEATWVEITTIP